MVGFPLGEFDAPMMEELRLENLLSFRDLTLDIRPLNVLIGANGTGKSNLIEAIRLLRALPRDLAAAIVPGRFQDWKWKGANEGSKPPNIDITLPGKPSGGMRLNYIIELDFGLGDWSLRETLKNERPYEGHADPYQHLRRDRGQADVNVVETDFNAQPDGKRRRRGRKHLDDLDLGQSIFQQFKDPSEYPEITHLANDLASIRIYQGWTMGRAAPARLPQSADLPNDHLNDDASNLGMVLNRLRRDGGFSEIAEAMKRFLPRFRDLPLIAEGGTVQIFLEEEGFSSPIPATRLSDGTLRFLALLAVLHNPAAPKLICIEEPEIGLHPDALTLVARALRAASERTRVIVTTHSPELIDALSDQPEDMVVCERGADGATTMERLDAKELAVWLETYRLGELWRKGQIGGNLWG